MISTFAFHRHMNAADENLASPRLLANHSAGFKWPFHAPQLHFTASDHRYEAEVGPGSRTPLS